MLPATDLSNFAASGLAGVWAEENTREAIYDAFRRKETFATSGPRMKVRFFAGYDLENSQILMILSLIQDAYAKQHSDGRERSILNQIKIQLF